MAAALSNAPSGWIIEAPPPSQHSTTTTTTTKQRYHNQKRLHYHNSVRCRGKNKTLDGNLEYPASNASLFGAINNGMREGDVLSVAYCPRPDRIGSKSSSYLFRMMEFARTAQRTKDNTPRPGPKTHTYVNHGVAKLSAFLPDQPPPCKHPSAGPTGFSLNCDIDHRNLSE